MTFLLKLVDVQKRKYTCIDCNGRPKYIKCDFCHKRTCGDFDCITSVETVFGSHEGSKII